MSTKKQPTYCYLDELETQRLKAIANFWGCSLSAALRRLIREHSPVEKINSLQKSA